MLQHGLSLIFRMPLINFPEVHHVIYALNHSTTNVQFLPTFLYNTLIINLPILYLITLSLPENAMTQESPAATIQQILQETAVKQAQS